MNKLKVVVSSRSVVTLILWILFFWAIFVCKDVLMLIFASFVIASALLPVVDWMSNKMPRGLAVGIIYSLGFLALAVFFIPFYIVLIEQLREFIRQTPTYITEIDKLVTFMKASSKGTLPVPHVSDLLSTSTALGKNIVDQSINLTVNIVGGMIAAFTLATVVLFFLLDKEKIKSGFLKFFPKDAREITEEITINISHKVGGYVRGQLIIMFLTGLLTAIALYVAGVKFALLLGMLAGLMEIVPIVGPILAAALAIIVALTQSPILAVITLAIFFTVQRIQNHILSPWIFGKFLDLHPLIIIFAILVTASTLGIIGVILSPAVAAAVFVLIQELYLKRINPENEPNPLINNT